MLLTFLGSTIGKYLIIAMVLAAFVGGAALYVKWTSDTIRTLTTQVTALSIQAQSLQAANAAMQHDITIVQQAQSATNQQLFTIRNQSAQAAKKIQTEVLSSSNVTALQNQINQDTANAFQALGALSQ